MAPIQFFALKDNLLPVLGAVERDGPLKYIRMGAYTEPKQEVFHRGADLPTLGKATSESASTSQSFLVCEADVPVSMRPVAFHAGGTNYHIDQLSNPDTITFTPGGLWTEEIVLYGRFATVSASFSEPTKRLMSRFRDQIKRHFVRVKAYYVGPNALGLLKAGKRLTIAEQSPHDFDLTLT
jgi:hypothetical protein